MSTQLAEKSCVELIDLTEERFKKIAPSEMSFDREKGFAIQLLENNDYLKSAALENPPSLLQAVTNVAAIGLSLNPAKKQAYLIPRNVKIGNQWQTRVFLEPGYMGLCDLLTSTGNISWIQANCVYASDEFADNGPGHEPTHKYNPFAKKEDRGDFVGVYSVAKTNEGDFLTTCMTADEIFDIKSRSELGKKNKGPWVTDFNEQAKKTVVRRQYKMLPKTSQHDRITEAIELSNENEGFEPIITSPNLGEFTVEQKKHFDHLIESSDGVGMFLFTISIDENVYTNLYHSFEKGEKGKYQKVVARLVDSGRSTIFDCIESINVAAESGDESAIVEIVETASQEELTYYIENCSEDAVSVLNEMREK